VAPISVAEEMVKLMTELALTAIVLFWLLIKILKLRDNVFPYLLLAF
jgi:hypothetical protein